MADKERRTYVRKEISLDVNLREEGEDGRGRTHRTSNLSMVGLFLDEDRGLAPGTRLELRLWLPKSREPLRILAEVVHRVPGTGMGLKFVEFMDDGRDRLLEFLGEETRIT